MDRRDEEVVIGAAPGHAFSSAWAECRLPLRRAALALWLPMLVPFAFGPLTECAHCVQSYLAILPVLPGALAAAWIRNTPVAFYALGLTATLVVLALVALLVGLAGRRWPWVAVPVALLSAAQAIGLAHLLRM